MCSQDNTDSFGAPQRGGIVGSALRKARPELFQPPAAPTSFAELFRPSPRGPAAPTGLASLAPSARGPAAPSSFADVARATTSPRGPAAPTGLASLTPSARGPRNRAARRGMEQ